MKKDESRNLGFNLYPLEQRDCFTFKSIKLKEQLGGDLATAEIVLCTPQDNEENNKLAAEVSSLTLTIYDYSGGDTYKIPLFVLSRKRVENIVTLDCTCVLDNAFQTLKITMEHDRNRDFIEQVNNLLEKAYYSGTRVSYSDSFLNISPGEVIDEDNESDFDQSLSYQAMESES